VSRRYRPFDPFERYEPSIRDFSLPRPPRRFWVGLGFIALALLVIVVTAPIVNFLTESQWFRALGLEDVYLTRVGLQVGLFVSALLIAFVFAAANVVVALHYRTGTALRAVGIRRPVLRSLAGVVGLSAAAVLALILSGGAGSQWRSLVLFLHASPTGINDPVYGLDVSFYLLTLPFLHATFNWALGLVFTTGLLVLGLYAWRGETFDFRLTAPAVGHLSILLALLALVTAGSTYLDRYDLLYQHHGFVWGAGYADVNGRLQVATVRTGLALLLVVPLAVNVVLRAKNFVIINAVVIWIVASILGAIYPAGVQRLAVQPAELTKEAPYIAREIKYTRLAFDLDQVDSQPFGGDANITQAQLAANQATIDNLRLWDDRPLKATYQQLQSFRSYYSFHSINLDRYRIDGKYQQLEISAREIDSDRLSQQTQAWINQKLQYTHGYGVAASPVSAVVGEGLPEYVISDIPPRGQIEVSRPQIYFGEAQPDGSYVLAPSAAEEFDYPKGKSNASNHYDGKHGVPMVGFNRTLWSLRLGDFNVLISPQIQDSTQLLYHRSVLERANAIAPFLTYDEHPYIVIDNGKLYWILDAYTTATTYPYSQRDENSGVNYIRNPVKVVIDAYEGTTDYYVIDPKDPLIRAYQSAFPTLFKPIDKMPSGLRQHLRVPIGLFDVQASVYRTYHVLDPNVFYNREDVWDFALEQNSPNSPLTRLAPYYVLMTLPGQSQPEYLLILPFTPRGKPNMVAWLAARNDDPSYGKVVAYTLSKDINVYGPQQVANRIQQTVDISKDFSLLNTQGSQVVQGNLLVVPIGDGFLYFEPIYLQATGGQNLPELKKVILVDKDRVVYTNGLKAALEQLTGAAVGSSPSPTPGKPPPSPGTGAPPALVQEALRPYNAAQEALRRGDLAGYQREIDLVGQILQQLSSESGASPGPAPTTTPRPGPTTPRASPSR
jgi:uncharacterized membrane protein (UPF0182 family)